MKWTRAGGKVGVPWDSCWEFTWKGVRWNSWKCGHGMSVCLRGGGAAHKPREASGGHLEGFLEEESPGQQ